MKRFKRLILSGTFDHFHLGHQSYLKTALAETESASCWLTTNWVSKNKLLPQSLQSFKQRLTSLKNFFAQNQLVDKVKISPLKNLFGPTLIDHQLEAIACTPDTLQTCRLINQKRDLNNLKPLKILLVNLVNAQDQKRISSTRIRKGEINRQGWVFQKLLPSSKTLFLPQNQRQYFKKPLGKLLIGSKANLAWASLKALKKIKTDQPPFIITVGDITTHAFLQSKIPVDLAIIDYRCQRQPISSNLHQQLRKKAGFIHFVKNHPGTLSKQTISCLKNILPQTLANHRPNVVQVKGEEDLLVLPAALLSPLKTSIFYGQPGKGLVQVQVTEKLKQKALKLLSLFRA